MRKRLRVHKWHPFVTLQLIELPHHVHCWHATVSIPTKGIAIIPKVYCVRPKRSVSEINSVIRSWGYPVFPQEIPRIILFLCDLLCEIKIFVTSIPLHQRNTNTFFGNKYCFAPFQKRSCISIETSSCRSRYKPEDFLASIGSSDEPDACMTISCDVSSAICGKRSLRSRDLLHEVWIHWLAQQHLHFVTQWKMNTANKFILCSIHLQTGLISMVQHPFMK